MKAEYLTGNAIDLLETGSEFFPALIAAIDAAKREFHLETYVFEDDAIGRAVAGAGPAGGGGGQGPEAVDVLARWLLGQADLKGIA